MSEEKYKPVADEQTLAKLLEAAFVLQEHNREMQRRGLHSGLRRKRMDVEGQAFPFPNPAPATKPAKPAASPDDASTLAKIVESQHQIQLRRLDFESALKLVADRVCEMTQARGAAIGIMEGKSIRYRAVAGHSTLISDSILPFDKSLLAPCLKSGEVFGCADTSTEVLLDADECKRRDIQSLIAVPVYHDGAIAGGLEVYFATPNAFKDQAIHTCQLMAGLVAEAVVREEEATWKKSLATERAAMLQALEKLRPSLAALVETPAAKGRSTDKPAIEEAISISCRKCGHQLIAAEQFCGQCGSPRAGEYESPNLQTKVASLWHMQELQKKTAGPERVKSAETTTETAADAPVESALARFLEQQIPELFSSEDLELNENSEMSEMPAPMKVQEIAGLEGGDLVAEVAEKDGLPDESGNDSQALANPEPTPAADWSSAASARAFLEQLASSKRTGTLLRLWNTHRGDIYLAIAVVLVACVIRWGLWSDHSVKATGAPARATATQGKPAPDAGLSVFDRMLIQLGLAEAPDPPQDKGNPAVQVWVDTRTALYYCPGADLYGKTPQGKLTTQRAAQLDQFEPAYRKVCN